MAMSLFGIITILLLAVCCASCALSGPSKGADGREDRSTSSRSPRPELVEGREEAIPFEVFAGFERLEERNPVFVGGPHEWAAAAHAVVVDDTVQYLWAIRRQPGRLRPRRVGRSAAAPPGPDKVPGRSRPAPPGPDKVPGRRWVLI